MSDRRRRQQSGLDAQTVRTQIRTLATSAHAKRVFGSDAHRFVLHPPLGERTVRGYERRYGMILPEPYRRFVRTVADGGAGPGYGMFRLRNACRSDDWFGGDPSRPFRHRSAWNLPEAAAIVRAFDGPGVRFQRAVAAWDRRQKKAYWRPEVTDGALPIAHHGCGLVDWLVVSGPEVGTVWEDLRECYGGLRPYDGAGGRMTFVEWYASWLAASLDRVRSAT